MPPVGLAGKVGLFCFALSVLASPFRSKLQLEAENTVLGHQLTVLRRRWLAPIGGRTRLCERPERAASSFFVAIFDKELMRRPGPIGFDFRVPVFLSLT
jgi:hypothetical protein